MIKGKLTPIKSNVIVEEMNFGEMKTKAGLIIMSDDGKDRGIKPRWGRIYAIGPQNQDEYSVGDYVLVEHGRWTRGVELEDYEGNKKTLRMVEVESILLWSDELPEDINFGIETDLSQPTHVAKDFVN